MSVLADDTALGIFNEGTDIFHFLNVGELLTGHGDTIFQHTLRIDDTIGFVDGLDGFAGEASTTQTYKVDTSVAHGFLASNHKGWDILTGSGATLEHDITAHMSELVEETCGGDDGKVIDNHLTGKLRGVADDAAVADLAVVADVHILHQQVAIANDGLAFRGRTATDGDILADGVVVANLTGGFLALELQILRFRRDRGTGEYLIIIAEACTEVEGHAVQQFIVVTNDNVLVYHAERSDDIVVAQLCIRIDDC